MEGATAQNSRAKRPLRRPGLTVFLWLHVTGLALWVVVNVGWVSRASSFDPYPFHLLTLIASLEAVLLCAVVLIRLSRMEARAEKRHRVALQAAMLVEEGIIEIAQRLELIEARLGVGRGPLHPGARGGADDRRARPDC